MNRDKLLDMSLTSESGVKIRHTKRGKQYVDPGELLPKRSVQETLEAAGEAFDLMSSNKNPTSPMSECVDDHAAKFYSATSCWREGEMEGFSPGLYLVEVERPEGAEMKVMKVTDASELRWEKLIRYARIYRKSPISPSYD